jgi:tRNA dimethylallyltransferase
MMEQGLVEEVKGLLPYRSHNALQTVGYKEIFDYLDGSCSLDEAVANIKTNTRRYAKRQLTWFRKDPSVQWVDSGDLNYL